jgi:hypothetical protein
LFDVLDFINDDKIDLVIGEDVADKFGEVGLLEFLEVESEDAPLVLLIVLVRQVDFYGNFLM